MPRDSCRGQGLPLHFLRPRAAKTALRKRNAKSIKDTHSASVVAYSGTCKGKMDLTVTWRGQRYIDFSRAWPTHAGSRAQHFPQDKKGKPGVLHKLNIPMAAAVVTKAGDFNASAHLFTRGGNKSYWITTQTWRDLVGPLPDGIPDPANDVTPGNDGDHDVHNTDADRASNTDAAESDVAGAAHLPPSLVTERESEGTDHSASSSTIWVRMGAWTGEFIFHGRPIHIRAYGERHPDHLYVNVSDVKTALGIRLDSPLPNDIDIIHATLPGGEAIDVLSHGEQQALMSAYRKKSELAKHICTWLNRLAFAAQYGEADIRAQIADAVDTQFSIVRDDSTDDHVSTRAGYYNYMIEVCSLTKLMEVFPDSAGILDQLPPDANPTDYVVVKYGTGKVDRARAVLKELRRLVPGASPRIVHTVRFPGAIEQDAVDCETEWKTEFSEVNIKGVTRGRSAYTEMFAVNAESAKRGVRRMDVLLENYNERRAESSSSAKTLLDDANLRMREAEFKCGVLEKTVSDQAARIQVLEQEVVAYKTTLKKTLSRSLASKLEAILK